MLDSKLFRLHIILIIISFLEGLRLCLKWDNPSFITFILLYPLNERYLYKILPSILIFLLFDSNRLSWYDKIDLGELAQLEERHVDIVEVAGSSPVLPTILQDLSCFFLSKITKNPRVFQKKTTFKTRGFLYFNLITNLIYI